MVLTTVLLVVSTVALPVETGTTSPTCRVATWLLTTTREGLDSTFTLVTAWSASRTKLGWVSEPIRKLKPGKARLMKAFETDPVIEARPVLGSTVVAGADVAWVLRIDPVFGRSPTPWLVM